MIKLRPHHLLCTQSYGGHGYNKEFIENMDILVKSLRQENPKIKIVYKVDDMCFKCPNRKAEKCITDEKVIEIDRKVVEYFNIEEKEYRYNEVIEKIKSEINVDILKDICGSCEWYKNKICTKKILR